MRAATPLRSRAMARVSTSGWSGSAGSFNTVIVTPSITSLNTLLPLNAVWPSTTMRASAAACCSSSWLLAMSADEK